MKARVIKGDYYVIATAMIKDSQVVSVDLQRYTTEEQAEKDFPKWRENTHTLIFTDMSTEYLTQTILTQ